jgi:hypothetical protein
MTRFILEHGTAKKAVLEIPIEHTNHLQASKHHSLREWDRRVKKSTSDVPLLSVVDI